MNHLTDINRESNIEQVKALVDTLRKDFESRTRENERLEYALNQSKADYNAAVGKLKKSEFELCKIKEEQTLLSNEIVTKSRVIEDMRNGANSNSNNELQRQANNL